jgi:DNA-binding transcriptional regulator LsrR (DeoR family)
MPPAARARVRHDGDEDTGTIVETVGLRLRFEHGLIQSEIAEHVGCSQMHVSRIVEKSLDGMALEASVPGAQPRRAA